MTRTYESDDTPLMLRFAIGSASLAWDRLEQALQRHARDGALPPPRELPPPTFRHLLIGVALSIPALARAAVQGAAGSPGGKLAALVAKGPVGRTTRRLTASLVTTIRERSAALARQGRDEDVSGRLLARSFCQTVPAFVLGRLAQSQELQSLVKEQSTGLGIEAVEDLRQGAARADALLERLLRDVARSWHTRRHPFDGGSR